MRGRRARLAALDDWQQAGLISAEQAAAIRAAESATSPASPLGAPLDTPLDTPRPTTSAPLPPLRPDASILPSGEGLAAKPPPRGDEAGRWVELVGSVGAVAVAAAGTVGTLVAWPDLSVGMRILIPAAAAVLLLAAGALVALGSGPRLHLRSLLWFFGAGAFAATAGVVAAQAAEWEPPSVVLAIGVAGLVVSVPLARWHRRPLQLVAGAIALAVTACGLVAHLDHATAVGYGLALWGVGVAGGLVAWGLRAGQVRTWSSLAAVLAVVGAVVVLGSSGAWGVLLGVATCLALMAVAGPLGTRVPLGIGVVGLFVITIRSLVDTFAARGETSAPRLGGVLIVFIVGLVLIAIAVIAAARSGRGPGAPPIGPHSGLPS